MPRWKNRPEGSNWGDFGPDDQVGRLNLLTPEKVLQGVAEVKEGRSFCLSLPLDYPGGNVLNPLRHPPKRRATTGEDGGPRYLIELSSRDPDLTDVVCDDVVEMHTQYSTQWDALSHVGGMFDADGDGVPEPVFYNGWRGGEDIVLGACGDDCAGDHGVAGVEAKKLGIETYAETVIQGRGVMVDLHRALGDERVGVTFEMLDRIMKDQKVVFEKGDMLVLHTGFGRKIMEMNKQPSHEVLHGACSALDGRDTALQNWIRDMDVVAICADNYAVELYPSREIEGKRAFLPIHELCLFKLGIPLGELWWLSDLADALKARDRSRFLLTAPALRLP